MKLQPRGDLWDGAQGFGMSSCHGWDRSLHSLAFGYASIWVCSLDLWWGKLFVRTIYILYHTTPPDRWQDTKTPKQPNKNIKEPPSSKKRKKHQTEAACCAFLLKARDRGDSTGSSQFEALQLAAERIGAWKRRSVGKVFAELEAGRREGDPMAVICWLIGMRL